MQIQYLLLWYSMLLQIQFLRLLYYTVTYRSSTCHCDILLSHTDPVPDSVIFYCHIYIQNMPRWYSTVTYRSSTCYCDILLLLQIQFLRLLYSTVTYRSSTCHCDILLSHIDPVPFTVIFYCHIYIQNMPRWYSTVTYRSSTSTSHCDILLSHQYL